MGLGSPAPPLLLCQVGGCGWWCVVEGWKRSWIERRGGGGEGGEGGEAREAAVEERWTLTPRRLVVRMAGQRNV